MAANDNDNADDDNDDDNDNNNDDNELLLFLSFTALRGIKSTWSLYVMPAERP